MMKRSINSRQLFLRNKSRKIEAEKAPMGRNSANITERELKRESLCEKS